MDLPLTIDPHQTYADELRTFSCAFFDHFGAPMTPLPDHPELLRVHLNDGLAKHFGKDELLLRFHRSDVVESELVAYGSRVFDQMLAYLDRSAALTLLQLPRQYAAGEELMRAVQPTNAGIAGLKLDEGIQLLYVFNWHITYRADDKQEELLTVVLDDEGNYVEPVAAIGSEDVDGEAYDTLHLVEQLLANGNPVDVAQGDDGQPLPPKLPPMTHLQRFAEQARKYAIYHADLQCIEHEAEVLPRLHKALSRLKTYYDQQIEEVYDSHDPDGEKRRILEQDLARKNDEEIENHRLHVQVRLFSYALVEVPTASAHITLRDGNYSVDIQVHRNLFNGDLTGPACYACGQMATRIALDASGHITCDDCICQCESCQQIYCRTCSVIPCPVCKRSNCEACSTACWACGERACTDHVSRCPVCGDTVCLSCQAECVACHRHLCRTHMRIDAVSGEAVDKLPPALICPDCAVRCPGCQQYSAQVGTCEISGQRFCENCLLDCVACGQHVGPGFYTLHPATGEPHCNDCTQICSQCGADTVATDECSTCRQPCCDKCGQCCDLCNQVFCNDHIAVSHICGHVLCVEHQATCAIGNEEVCPVCRPSCAVCQRPYCAEHATTCSRCRREVCAECVRRSGLCDTCATHDRDGEFVSLVDEPCAGDDRVVYLTPHYRWMRTRNARYTIYLGRDRNMSAAIIVVENKREGDEVLLARRLGILDSKYRERWI